MVGENKDPFLVPRDPTRRWGLAYGRETPLPRDATLKKFTLK